ncbi:MAG: ABC transporter substrate-binding protein [Candidatus Eremiobacteraeota bacterium]|nr:ABC transporter substrate-binding protein [Candidatus Eremiobacteraeota bacterium]
MIRALAAALAMVCCLGAAPPLPRIVALVPSLAEDAFAVGAHVVAVSKFTDDSPQARGLPVVADFQSVDAETILRLHPDVVVGIPAQARLTDPLRRAGVRVVLVPDDSYDDIFHDLRVVGELADRTPQAVRVIAQLQRETAQLHAKAVRAYRPSVFFALGTGPIWTVGPHSYLATLIELAGGRNAADDLATPYGEYSEEALLRAQPDAIVAGHETNIRDVIDHDPWRSLRAVREGHVFTITDQRIANALFRPGPRYTEGLRWLIERLSSLSTPKTQNVRSNRS